MKKLLVSLLLVCAASLAVWRLAGASKVPASPFPTLPASSLQAGASATNGSVAVAPAGPTQTVRTSFITGSQPDQGARDLTSLIDRLLSPQTRFAQKKELWAQLRKGGQLEDAIATLKQLTAANPQDPVLATALGEVEVNQIKNLRQTGGSFTSIAILAMQADQNFDAALSVDPTNWEAQFDKAAALSAWPSVLNKGPEVIQILSALVTQQAAMAPQPEFDLPYVYLGQQYQAAGQPDKAAAVWQQGLAQFPLSVALQKAVAQAPAH